MIPRRGSKQERRDGHGARRPPTRNERNNGTHTEQRAARDDGTQASPPDDKQDGARKRADETSRRRTKQPRNEHARRRHPRTSKTGRRATTTDDDQPMTTTRRRRGEASNGDDARQDRRRQRERHGPQATSDDEGKQASKNEGTTRENSTNPIERGQRQATGATEITQPADAIDTAAKSKTHKRNRPATSTAPPRQATGSNDRDEPMPRRKPHSPRPTCRTSGEPNDTTIGAERIASRPARDAAGKPERETRSKQDRTRQRSHEKDEPRMTGKHGKKQAPEPRTTIPDDGNGNDDAKPRMSKERGEGRDENGHARAYPIRSHHLSDREPRRPIHHPRRAVFASSPQTARGTRGRREAHAVHMKNENPISK